MKFQETNKSNVIDFLNKNYVGWRVYYDYNQILQDISDIQDYIDNNINLLLKVRYIYITIKPGSNDAICIKLGEKDLYQKR